MQRIVVLVLVALTLAGCASRPVNERLTQIDPKSGYRPYLMLSERVDNDAGTLFVLALSGGGTRAAALSYGVPNGLRRTDIVVDGKRRRLVDEVDIITGVSGGSFTALAYALYGDRLFAEYEQRFLKRDVQGELQRRALNPFYWSHFIGGTAGRSELAADFYDEIPLEGAMYADLLAKSDPVAVANGTDITTGSRPSFYQNDFDMLCTDLSTVRLSRAAATSSAVPVVDVNFDDLADAKEREHYMNLPTSFVLPREDVDGLREVAGRLLRASPEYQALLREWGGAPPSTKAP